ncbi:uncharacterized protein LOC127280835 [Leptopilina boulardi]|uniref:uncharacterized protein LOC127280835 n=1 Tax=Leptopilina boulardi TaxID=63433 RepID=UPI0021F5D84E|nr:uncharacterized protein LOC127280835 [Leptopilina boulardi]XP_051160078.1 uncharacterized protein LOC127280835 [Leptopilina boulardi]
MEAIINPLEAVKLIPIFNYINMLSDFLYFEYYLKEIDQNKQIPIVNALYEYLDDHQNNKFKKTELIRVLLQGSDMYGANIDEHVDGTFVNVMFDYIISSLLFDKYGNIYGFLAYSFCKVENLKIEEVLNTIRINLKNASFDNEYGNSSTLSDLSVARIYNDIILPLFPQPNDSLNLLSLDYIYAQAGSMFLRAGRINSEYYPYFINYVATQPDDNNLFKQYLVTGHLIEKLLLIDEKNFEILKAFALPALSYYIVNFKYLFEYQQMDNVILESIFWQTAYKHLFQYTTKSFNDINTMLKYDYTLKMHATLSSFQSRIVLAKTFMSQHCRNLNLNETDSALQLYLNYPKSFLCKTDNVLPDPNEYFRDQIYSIIQLYETYDFQLIQEAFSKYLIENLQKTIVTINLVTLHNAQEESFESEHLSYDLLQFNFLNSNSSDFYILKREDYNAKLIKFDDDTQDTKDIKLPLKALINFSTFIILKTPDENIDVFFKNLIKYKKTRLEFILKNLEYNKGNSDWWKEFGFSLVPYYPCLSNTSEINDGNMCKSGNIGLFYKYPLDIASKAIDTHSRTLLSSLGTNIKSVYLKNASNEAVDSIISKEQKFNYSITNTLDRKTLFEDISLHIKDPEFQLKFITKEMISKLEKVINSLREKIDFNFTSVISCLTKITTLKSISFRNIGSIGKNKNRAIFINILGNKSDTGYGYKFIFLSRNVNETAQLRTGYELKDERLFSQGYREKEKKMYIALNNTTFQIEPVDIMYEINYQLRRSHTRLLFFGVPIQTDDYNENCKDNRYFKGWQYNKMLCHRERRFREQSAYKKEAEKFIHKNTNFPKEYISDMLEKLIFPDNITLTRFVNDCLKDNSFKAPIWSENFTIENPEILNKLRYNLRFEEHTTISEYDAEFRINYLYSKLERSQIEEGTSIENIIKDYNKQKASFSVSFHDYYAIRNYATTGYRRITGNTDEAKLMKIALYKLAIRQSDDPVDEFDLTLFRVESKSIAFLRSISRKSNITLQKFTQVSPSMKSATKFSGLPAVGNINIVYEMIFTEPYLRAKILQFYESIEKNVILLPGSEFIIDYSKYENIEGLGRVLKVKLIFQHTPNDKYVWYKNIMFEITNKLLNYV